MSSTSIPPKRAACSLVSQVICNRISKGAYLSKGTNRHRSKAFTLIELLVVIAVIITVCLLILPANTNEARKAARLKCASNLKQISLSLYIDATDHNGKYLWERTNSVSMETWRYFLSISNELGGPKLLVCPGDYPRHSAAAQHFGEDDMGLAHTNWRNRAVSYFLGTSSSTNEKLSILSGDRNLAPADEAARYYRSPGGHPTKVELESVWSLQQGNPPHDNSGNLAFADGSVRKTDDRQLREALRLARGFYGTNANRFLFPQ